MALKVRYQISSNIYDVIEVINQQEVELVKTLNRNLDNFYKKEKYHNKDRISIDQLKDDYNFEFAYEEIIPYEEENNLKLLENKIQDALLLLTKKQKEVIFKVFWESKSLRQIARENNISHSSINKTYQFAIKKLKKYLQKN